MNDNFVKQFSLEKKIYQTAKKNSYEQVTID